MGKKNKGLEKTLKINKNKKTHKKAYKKIYKIKFHCPVSVGVSTQPCRGCDPGSNPGSGVLPF